MNKDGGVSHKLHGLDHLRAFAIIFVFLFHYGRLFPHPDWVNAISEFGWTGVDLFFVLSGYLIASQLFADIQQQRKISLKQFYLKRFFRIIPAYLVVVALYFLFPFVRERESLAPLWKYLTFTQNIHLDLLTQGTFSHAWSLCIEEQFYLFLPFILAALLYFNLFKKSYWLLIALFVFGLAIRYYSYQHVIALTDMDKSLNWYEWIYYPTWCRLDGLLAGVTIAALMQFRPAIKEKMLQHANVIFIAGLFVFAIAYFLCSTEQSLLASVFGFPLVSIGYGCIVASAISPKNFLYKWKSNITSKIATLSYGIYLIHKMVIHVTQNQFAKLKIDDAGFVMFLICILMVTIASIILNEVVEKPFLKLRRRLNKKPIKF